jgi:hypothetical protein
MNHGSQMRGLSEIDRTQMLQFFFYEYTQAILNGENSAWTSRADSAV